MHSVGLMLERLIRCIKVRSTCEHSINIMTRVRYAHGAGHRILTLPRIASGNEIITVCTIGYYKY